MSSGIALQKLTEEFNSRLGLEAHDQFSSMTVNKLLTDLDLQGRVS